LRDRTVPPAGGGFGRVTAAINAEICSVLGADQPEHDDLVQATLERVVRTVRNGRFQHACSLAAWAGSIAAHLALNAIRSRRCRRAVFADETSLEDLADSAPTAGTLHEHVAAVERLGQLRSCLAELSAVQREAVVLHDLWGYDLREVAAISGTSLAAAQSRLVRGRKELTALLSHLP
jgi:RNA polymerase sigma-70 factor (ECF subfamily)